MEWISVKDSLPNNFDIYSQSETVIVWESDEIRFGWIFKESKQWGVMGRLGEIKVTHWMPLPEPPKSNG